MDDDGENDLQVLAGKLTQKVVLVAAEEQHRAMATTHQISRIPAHLRDVNAEVYTPGFVAIGPLHSRDNRRFRPAERLKVAYLNSLVSRGYPEVPDLENYFAVIHGYVNIVAARESEVWALYAVDEMVGIDHIDFVQMMVLDGCFIIEHLVNVAIGREEPSLHATPLGPLQLSLDLILAENQIPFFILVDLISGTKLPEFEATGYAPPVLLMKLVLYYLAGEKGRDMSEALPGAENVSHILHLLHMMITTARTRWESPPPFIQERTLLKTAQEAGRLLRRLPLLFLVPVLYRILPRGQAQQDVPSASDLKRMSVKLQKAHGVEGSKPVTGIASVMGPVPLAVNLTRENLLQLPQLRFEFRTAALVLNLMAFEQSRSSASLWGAGLQQDVSAYVSFMAKMVQSAEDAGVLAAADVVHVHGGTGSASMEKVARFFRAAGAASEAAIELHTSYLAVTVQALMPRVPTWTDVRENYFTFLAELVAIVTFISGVATIAQTYAAFKYH